jgi:UDP-N-acetyl-D-mannosaminuronic acid transferase (WecB/TagA/CpsF family)
VELYQKIRRAVMIDGMSLRWASRQNVNLGFSHHLAYRDMAKNV